jgi:hypothetical protein
MLTRRLAVMVLGGVSLAAIGLALHARSRSEANERAVRAELSSLRDELTSLRADQRQVKLADVVTRVAAAQAAAPGATPVAPTQEPAAAPLSREEHERRFNEHLRQRVEQLDQVFATDAVDRGWSAATVESMQRVFAGVTGAHLRDAQCASHLCRVEVEHASRDEQRALAEQVLTQEPFTHGVLFDYDKVSVPPKTTLYVARDGVTLAKLGREPG